MIDTEKYIKKLRSFMKNDGVDCFIVNATDEYLNEYIDLNENSRYYLTNFSGSTGDALVTQDDVFLFVDGRYHLQADEETDSELIKVVKLKLTESSRSSMVNKIKEFKSNKIGIVSSRISMQNYIKLQDELSEFEFKEYSFDPIIDVKKESMKTKPIQMISQEITGVSASVKVDSICNKLKDLNLDMLVISKLDEIAYLTNLRSYEIPYNSTFKAKALVDNSKNKCYIFTDLKRINQDIKTFLGDKFYFYNESEFEDIISELSKTSQNLKNIAYDLINTNLSTYRILENTGYKIKELMQSPVSEMKAVKNPKELGHLKECFRKTDIAVSRAISRLNQNIDKDILMSEKEFSDLVKQFFFEEGAQALSFETIAASGKNSAFIHYTNSSKTKLIKEGELVLLDCGAYFEGGYATDITRTFLAAKKHTKTDDKTKQIYTKVLKAFLNALNVDLDGNISGYVIDKTARLIITENIEKGFHFSHGTGHGVGINVHESPPRISSAEQSKQTLKEGMVFTIEPGMYNDNWGGVRLENTVMLKDDKIQSLAHSKFDEKLIDYFMLNEQEKKWLNNYNRLSL